MVGDFAEIAIMELALPLNFFQDGLVEVGDME